MVSSILGSKNPLDGFAYGQMECVERDPVIKWGQSSSFPRLVVELALLGLQHKRMVRRSRILGSKNSLDGFTNAQMQCVERDPVIKWRGQSSSFPRLLVELA